MRVHSPAREIPGYTYLIGAACVAVLAIGLATLQRALDIAGAADGALLGLAVAVHFSLTTALPYTFLKRWSAFVLAMGSQTVLIIALSVTLAVW